MLCLEVQVLKSLAEAHRTPLSLQVIDCIERCDWLQLLSLKVDHSQYNTENRDEFFHDYLVTSFLKKFPDLNVTTPRDRKNACYTSFFETEKRVEQEGRRFAITDPATTRLKEVGREFGRILGKLDKVVAKEVCELASHGPGGALYYSTTGKRPSNKFSREPFSCTRRLLPFARSIMGDRWHDEVFNDINYYQYFSMVEDSRSLKRVRSVDFVRDYAEFATVPKTALTDRPIGKEPLLNLYLQKGIGAYFKKRMKKFGIDLREGQDVNRGLVADAWKLGLATIDLKAASDSIATQILMRIANVTQNGRDWLHLLNLARTECMMLKAPSSGKRILHELKKFSSMGNGFTFELESILFYCIVRVIVPRKKYQYCAVYGDDIICPEEHAHAVIDLLVLYGFQVNQQKTFTSGCFKESCGHDYFYNENCRPVFLGSQAEDIAVSRPIFIANAIRLYSRQINGGFSCSRKYIKAYSLCLREARISEDYPRVPDYLYGHGLVVPLCDALNRNVYPLRDRPETLHLEGFCVPIEVFNTSMRRSCRTSFLLRALISIGRTDIATYGIEPILRNGGKIKRGSTIVPLWDDSLRFDSIRV
jgi:hypothetical protein